MLNALKKMIGMPIIDEPTGRYVRLSYSRSDRHDAR
jgi:hypothetical protein